MSRPWTEGELGIDPEDVRYWFNDGKEAALAKLLNLAPEMAEAIMCQGRTEAEYKLDALYRELKEIGVSNES